MMNFNTSNLCGGARRRFQRSRGLQSSVFSLRSSVCRPRSDCRGFSLMELITVMLIMFIMMGIATTAFRGVVRGAGMRGAITVVRSSLMQARQHAMMNGQPVAVLIMQEDDEPGKMMTLASYGSIVSVNAGVAMTQNELPWTVEQLNNAIVYNFDGDSARLRYDSNRMDPDSQTEFIIDGGGFGGGDEIAFLLGATREISSGLRFDGLANGDRQVIIFNADGSVAQAGEFEILEQVGDAGFTISVDPSTGKVRVD